MKTLAIVALLLFSSLSLNVVKAEDPKPDAREKLDTAIPEAIKLLKAKDNKKLLERYVAPDDLKKMTDKVSIEEFAKKFGEEKAPRLLSALEEIKDSKPTFDKTETKATYALSKEMGGKKSITFKKVEKLWYISN